MEVKYTVKKVLNGWIIESEDSNGDTSILVGRDDELSEQDMFLQFLFDIKEQFGPQEDQFSESVLRMVRLPGDEFEGRLSPEREHELRDLRDYIDRFLLNE